MYPKLFVSMTIHSQHTDYLVPSLLTVNSLTEPECEVNNPIALSVKIVYLTYHLALFRTEHLERFEQILF